MESVIQVSHQTIELKSSFEDFTTRLEGLLGHLDPASSALLATDPQRAEQELAKMGGDENLILFEVRNYGDLLRLSGMQRKAKQYEIGNPLIAKDMAQHDLRAGLYAPLRVLVYETAEQQLRAEYDLPSSLFGQFQNTEVTAVAQRLDSKLLKVLQHADTSSAVRI